ncbi:MAG: hypothetical protein P8P99_00995 [Maricaulis sp.]|nr:hypothetical protein [Maricaulis sp.]
MISIVLFVLPGILAARLENPLASIFPIMVPAGIAYLGASLGASAPVFQKFSFPNWLTPALYGIGLAGLVSIWGNLVQNIPDVFASNAGGGILGVSFTISASGLSSLGHMFSIGWVQPSPRNLFFIFSEASILMAGAYVVGRSLSNTFDVRSMVIGFIAFIGFPDLIFTILGLPFFGFAIPSIVKVALTLVFTLMVLSFVRAGFASRSALVAPFIENRNRS